MSAWFSPSSIAGAAIAVAFLVVATRDLRRGLLLYAILGVSPVLAVGAFAGNEMVEGIPLAEILASILFGVWLMQHRAFPLGRIAPFEGVLALLLPASLLSLFSGYTWLDHDVPQQNVNLAVSIGQILLFAWPMAVYLTTSRVGTTADWRASFTRLVLWLAVPHVVTLVAPATKPFLGWSVYFGLIAAPLAFARAAHETRWPRRLLWSLYLLPPLIEGVMTGKAFLYGYIVLSALVIGWVRLRRLVWLALPALGLLVTLGLLMPDDVTLPGPLAKLVETERAQQSLGGRSGRAALIEDAVAIWSRYPILGVGPANSYPYMLRYSVLGTPHSQYADLLLECGVVGLGLAVVFIVLTALAGQVALGRPRPPDDDIFLTAWIGSFVAWSVLSFTGDYMLHSIRNDGLNMFTGFYLQWVFLGATMGMLRAEARRHATATAGVRVWRRAAAPASWPVSGVGPRLPATSIDAGRTPSPGSLA